MGKSCADVLCKGVSMEPELGQWDQKQIRNSPANLGGLVRCCSRSCAGLVRPPARPSTQSWLAGSHSPSLPSSLPAFLKCLPKTGTKVPPITAQLGLMNRKAVAPPLASMLLFGCPLGSTFGSIRTLTMQPANQKASCCFCNGPLIAPRSCVEALCPQDFMFFRNALCPQDRSTRLLPAKSLVDVLCASDQV